MCASASEISRGDRFFLLPAAGTRACFRSRAHIEPMNSLYLNVSTSSPGAGLSLASPKSVFSLPRSHPRNVRYQIVHSLLADILDLPPSSSAAGYLE